MPAKDKVRFIMQSPVPEEFEQLSQLFEKNTIRQTAEPRGSRLDLALPEPIDSVTGIPPRAPTPPRSERTVLMPFASHQSTEKKAAPAASNRVAHLNRLLEINPEPLVSHTDASWRSSADSRAPEKPAEPTRSHREHLKLEAESVEMRLQIKRQQVQLETARILMQLALPLEQRLQSALKHWVQSFDFWGARLQLTDLGHPLHQYPCDLEWVSTRLKNWKYQRLGTKQRLHHQAYPDYQELMISLQKQNQSYGQLSLAYSPAQTLSAESEQDLKVLADDMSQFLEDLAAYQWTRSAQMEDPLTGLPNHTGFQLAFEAMIDTRSQKKLPMACFMLDLDFLTQINEVHGYEQGDLVLQHLTQILMKHLPDNAILGRLGNDRFGVVLSQLSLIEAADWGEKFRQAIARQPLSGKFESPLDLTISLGLAYQESVTETATILGQSAESLARAKDRGRNQLQIYRPEPARPVNSPPSASRTEARAVKQTEASQPSKTQSSRPVPATHPEKRAQGPVVALQWSEILKAHRDELESEWQQQTADYGMDEVTAAVGAMQERLGRLLDSLCALLDQKSNLADLETMPLSYFIPSPVVAAIRRGDKAYQLTSYEVAFMLLQESMENILPQSAELEAAMDGFFHCVNSKLTGLKASINGK